MKYIQIDQLLTHCSKKSIYYQEKSFDSLSHRTIGKKSNASPTSCKIFLKYTKLHFTIKKRSYDMKQEIISNIVKSVYT